MKPVPDSWSIVLAGMWNVGILHPDWLAKNLFDSTELKIEIPIGPIGLLRVSSGGVRVLTGLDRVQFTPAALDDESLRRTETLARKLLQTLPHTPMTAIGVNFAFREDDPDSALLSHFQDTDASAIVDAGFTLESHAAVRRIKQADGQLVNFKVERHDEAVLFDFNFHSPVGNAGDAVAALDTRILTHRETALRLLSTVYNLDWSVVNEQS